jgi:hypothetical protein
MKKMLLAAVVATGLGIGATGTALAHGPGGQSYGGQGYGHGMMMPQMMSCPAMMGFGMHPGMMMHHGMLGHGMMHHGMMGPGMMGPGMMGPGMMGPGMMGRGMGQGMMMEPGSGMHGGGQADLSADEVRARLERWLAWQGNPRLALGDVTEESEDAVVADIVTQDGSLVDRLRVDRHTGAMQRVP